MSSRSARTVLIATLAASLLGCGPEPFRVTEVQLGSDRGRVPLDAVLRVEFSREIEHGSVGPQCVRVWDTERDVALEGELRVHGATVEFHPRLPLRADLADAGLPPDTRCALIVQAAPALAVVRDHRGTPLEVGRRLEFRTAAPDGPAFRDPPPPRGPALVLERSGWHDGNRRRVALTFDEPIDPRTVERLRVWLFGPWDPQDLAWPARRAANPDLQFRLTENGDRATLVAELPDPLPLRVEGGADTLSLVIDARQLLGTDGRSAARSDEDDRREVPLPLPD